MLSREFIVTSMQDGNCEAREQAEGEWLQMKFPIPGGRAELKGIGNFLIAEFIPKRNGIAKIYVKEIWNHYA